MMKKQIVVLILLATTISFAQQSPSTLLNKKKSEDGLSLRYTPKHNLNLDSFMLEKARQKDKPVSKSFYRSNGQRPAPIDNMPIYESKGKFFLEIYEIDDTFDHKLKIFEFQESKYYFKTLG